MSVHESVTDPVLLDFLPQCMQEIIPADVEGVAMETVGEGPAEEEDRAVERREGEDGGGESVALKEER